MIGVVIIIASIILYAQYYINASNTAEELVDSSTGNVNTTEGKHVIIELSDGINFSSEP